ncbi:hypothetical protein M0R45_004544 [Rubus argutus]|uniref:Uncharacterized protein n=1 Tax=Rubus argutus TaxID=59490 RepID=A0AAW1YK22_RUBAR
MELSRGLHLDFAAKEIGPVRPTDFRVRDSKESSVIKKVETMVRLVVKGMKLRSMEETRFSLQETPEKSHGFWLRSQLKRRVGFGGESLKLRS